jgi:hypothetical protein
MPGINSRDLDNWITGHYGEDQYRNGEIEREEAITDDEGWQTLENAIVYLRREEAPQWDVTEECDILTECKRLIERDFECMYCGEPLSKKRRYCSSGCAKAAEL